MFGTPDTSSKSVGASPAASANAPHAAALKAGVASAKAPTQARSMREAGIAALFIATVEELVQAAEAVGLLSDVRILPPGDIGASAESSPAASAGVAEPAEPATTLPHPPLRLLFDGAAFLDAYAAVCPVAPALVTPTQTTTATIHVVQIPYPSAAPLTAACMTVPTAVPGSAAPETSVAGVAVTAGKAARTLVKGKADAGESKPSGKKPPMKPGLHAGTAGKHGGWKGKGSAIAASASASAISAAGAGSAASTSERISASLPLSVGTRLCAAADAALARKSASLAATTTTGAASTASVGAGRPSALVSTAASRAEPLADATYARIWHSILRHHDADGESEGSKEADAATEAAVAAAYAATAEAVAKWCASVGQAAPSADQAQAGVAAFLPYELMPSRLVRRACEGVARSKSAVGTHVLNASDADVTAGAAADYDFDSRTGGKGRKAGEHHPSAVVKEYVCYGSKEFFVLRKEDGEHLDLTRNKCAVCQNMLWHGGAREEERIAARALKETLSKGARKAVEHDEHEERKRRRRLRQQRQKRF